MPAKKQYTAEFKEQAVTFVLEETGPDRVGEVSVDVLFHIHSVQWRHGPHLLN